MLGQGGTLRQLLGLGIALAFIVALDWAARMVHWLRVRRRKGVL